MTSEYYIGRDESPPLKFLMVRYFAKLSVPRVLDDRRSELG
jgi:hypothetical protein